MKRKVVILEVFLILDLNVVWELFRWAFWGLLTPLGAVGALGTSFGIFGGQMPPKRPKKLPRAPQDGPKRPQEAPEARQKGPKRPLRGPKRLPKHPPNNTQA